MSKVVLIAGASTGLGESIATYLVRRGYRVYGTSRQANPPGKSLAMLRVDVVSIQKAVEQALEQEGRIDVLINNANLGIAAPVELMTLADVQQVLATNVTGVFRMVQAVLSFPRQRQSGLNINTSSIATEAGLPCRGACSDSKAAVERLT